MCITKMDGVTSCVVLQWFYGETVLHGNCLTDILFMKTS